MNFHGQGFERKEFWEKLQINFFFLKMFSLRVIDRLFKV